MRDLTKRLLLGVLVLGAGATTASSEPVPRKLGPFGDKPASSQSLPGDNLPPFNMLDAKGKLIPMPNLGKPLHESGGGKLESTAPGPNLALATKMAHAAVMACKAKGWLVGAAVIDSDGEARAMLTVDGADGSHVFVAMRKAETALAFGTSSLQANENVTSGKALLSKVTPDMFVMGGAVTISKGGKLIGAIGVSGAAGAPPPGSADESCAKAGLAAAGPGYK
jgi:uncharacterized protein GlcG (DUF336 family)